MAGGTLPSSLNQQLMGGTIAGRYRLVYRYWTVGVDGVAQEARSGSFDVVE